MELFQQWLDLECVTDFGAMLGLRVGDYHIGPLIGLALPYLQ